MNIFFRRFTKALIKPRGGVFCVGLLGFITAGSIFCLYVPPVTTTGTVTSPNFSSGSAPVTKVATSGVKVTTSLSQTKIVLGDTSPLYLKLVIETPQTLSLAGQRQPVDMVVVLDRSGSMSDSTKLPFARSAIQELLTRLNSDDRFGLITFDDTVRIDSELVELNSTNRNKLSQLVSAIGPGGSTNVEGGLHAAQNMLRSADSGRSRRIILLSDGEANVGVSDTPGLSQIARAIGQNKGVLSTIGLGAGFNETLMASLADNGMGNYAWLERLDRLGDIFAKDLNEARTIFASASRIEIKLPNGIALLDAGGYPVEKHDGKTFVVTGQLLENSTKQFFITLQPSTRALGDQKLGDMALAYESKNGLEMLDLPSTSLVLAVVAPERRSEVTASLNQPVILENAATNSYGILQRKVAEAVRSGRKEEAKGSIAAYQATLANESQATGLNLMSDDVRSKIGGLQKDVDEAFVGSAPQQASRQAILAKQTHADSYENQRKTSK